jgi:hypothetical protein
MTTTLKLAVAAGAALVAGPQSSQAQVRATAIAAHGPAVTSSKHMLYRVRGPNGATVYVLGSVHLLSADAATLPAEVDSAFAHSRSLTLETSIDSIQARGPEMLMRGQYSDGRTLRGTLSAKSATKVDSLLHLYGLSLDQVNAFKPWMVSLLMTQLAMQKLNLQAQYGVDMQLNTRAKQASKPVRGLESVDFQMGLFDALSPADQERLLVDSDGPDVTAKELGSIQDAWRHGDAAMLDSLINSHVAEAPTLFDALITARNRAWIPKIETLIRGGDDALIVVGAGHLVGKQGVVAMLRAKGYTLDQM